MKRAKAVGIQYAALPYRIQARQVRVLLITSRGTQRWVIPKGWPMNGLKPAEAAAVEASEEAGLIGEVETHPIGSYRYLKEMKGDQSLAVQVIVFPMRVQAQAEHWKEFGQRRAQWFRYQDAAAEVAEPSLRRLIQDFGAERSPTLLALGLRTLRSWRMGARS